MIEQATIRSLVVRDWLQQSRAEANRVGVVVSTVTATHPARPVQRWVLTMTKRTTSLDFDSLSAAAISWLVAQFKNGNTSFRVAELSKDIATDSSLQILDRVLESFAANGLIAEVPLFGQSLKHNRMFGLIGEKRRFSIEPTCLTAKENRRSTRPKQRVKKAAPTAYLIEQAMRSYHNFDGGIVDRTIPPTSGRKLASIAEKRFSPRSVDRWIESRFGSKEAYEAACLDDRLGQFLAVDMDAIRAFGTSHQLEHEVTDDECNAPTFKVQRGNRKVTQRF